MEVADTATGSEPAVPIVLLQPHTVNYCQEGRPSLCSCCSGDAFQRWGGLIQGRAKLKQALYPVLLPASVQSNWLTWPA